VEHTEEYRANQDFLDELIKRQRSITPGVDRESLTAWNSWIPACAGMTEMGGKWTYCEGIGVYSF
jgi:hypothetical protein